MGIKRSVFTTVILGELLCMITYTFDFLPDFYFNIVIYRIILCGILILYMYKLGLSDILSFSWKSFRYGLFCSGLFFIFLIWVLTLNVISVETYFSIKVVDFICRMLMIGVMEELIYRGALLNVMIRHGSNTVRNLWKAVIISSMVFGLSHYMNLIYSPFIEVSLQVYNAFCVGTLFSAIFIRCNNIWVCAFLHALWDFANLLPSFFDTSEEVVETISGSISLLQVLGSLIEPTIFLIIGIFLLRNIRKEQMLSLK